MDVTKFLVSLVTVMTVLLVATISVSATTDEIVTIESVKIDGITEVFNEDISVIAGEKISVQVIFEALENASDVRIEAELRGVKSSPDVEVLVGDVEEGKRYIKTLSLTVPHDLKNIVSDDIVLEITVWNKDFKTNVDEITLRVQRSAYDVAVMSVETSQTINAGDTFAVDIVLKNIGYNDLDDLYVTAAIPALGVISKAYFGDLVAIEVDDDDSDKSDTVRGRMYLTMPFSAGQGVYSLEVGVTNEDLSLSQVKQVFVANEVPNEVIKSGNSLILVNPSNKIKIYNVIPESPATVSNSVVVVPAGSSKTVEVSSNGAKTFTVNILSGDRLVGTVDFTGTTGLGTGYSDVNTASPTTVLVVILTIIFVVLLVALIVLLTKKPEKEEFGESYY